MLNRILGRDIAYYVKEHRALVICSLVLTALSSLLVVVPAYLLKPFIDEGMRSGTDPVSWKIPWIIIQTSPEISWHVTEKTIVEGVSPNRLLVLLTGIAFVSVLLKSITVYLGQLSAAAFSNRAIRSLRVDLFNKFLSLPLSFYHKNKVGELVSRSTADLTVMQDRIANILIGIVQYPVMVIVFMAYLFIMNIRLTLIVFITVPPIIGLIRLFGRKVKKHSTRVQEATSHVTSAYQENLVCLKEIQGFCIESHEASIFKSLADNLYKRVMRWNRWFLGLGPMMDSTVFLVLPAVLIIGKVYFHHTLGELMSMVYAFSRVYSPVKNLARINNELKTLQGATERVFSIMKTTPEIVERPDAITLPRHQKSIEFRNVYFEYKPGVPVLKDINFRIHYGEMVAFVGSTGAGKSTLLDLIPRFYDVTRGAILIDSVDIRDVTLKSLRGQIAMVSQEVLLFHDSIAENIAPGSGSDNMNKIISSAKIANAHEFILSQPGGYNTVVGDRGTLLSGGQRQRIAIARAIYSDPSILLLDEAASALDAESERLVQEAIEKLRGSMTILVVAHRLSTVKNADRIFVIEKGMIVESGTPQELISLNGRFKRLYDMQFRA